MAAKRRDIQNLNPTNPSPKIIQQEEAFGFSEWKQKRILMAKIAINEFRVSQTSINVKKTEGEEPSRLTDTNSNQTPSSAPGAVPAETPSPTNDPSFAKQIEERMRQLEFNLEIAQGLTIHDYFALYLKDKNKETMAAAIKKLNPDELSELLTAYRNVLYGSPRLDKDKVNELN